MSFGEFLWNMLIIYLWIFYLITVFYILGDLFRDRETGGFVKVAWVIFMLFFPFLAVLVYLIVRGKGMTERSQARAAAAEAAQREYVQRLAASGPDASAQIQRGRELLECGAISASEFATLKAQALGYAAPATSATAAVPVPAAPPAQPPG